ncbi:hypothetical protein BJ741DRAFT_654807 [Chytriomyces cf. hyalinus JEL632]|nr:hypothetical protein BJ741DRAFT_654807 [Chytriomyces cf. hyalinus JEL632]
MLDLSKLEQCQGKWYTMYITPQYAGKMMNCTRDSWRMFDCFLFSSRNTSLLFASDTLVITQAPYHDRSRTFSNLTGIWSYNASEETAWNSVYAPPTGIVATYNPALTEYGLFGLDRSFSPEWLYSDNGVNNRSKRVGFCFEDEAPYVTYRDAAGTILWGPNNATKLMIGIPSSSLVDGQSPVTTTSPNNSGGYAVAGVVVVCLLGAFYYSQKKPVAYTSDPIPLVDARNMNESRRDDIEALPLYQEHDMESSAVSLVSTAQSAFSPGEQAGQVRSGLDSWTTDDVVAWVRLNGGDESMEQVVRMEGMDGSVVRSLDADDLLSVFAFDTDAQRDRMKNALVSLQSHDGNNEPPRTYEVLDECTIRMHKVTKSLLKMVDLRLLNQCRWNVRQTTTTYAGKPMNCTSEEWTMLSCSAFSNGNTSLLYAHGALVITQAPFDQLSNSFSNLTTIWSFNASLLSSLQAEGHFTSLTRYGLFGFRHSSSPKWLFDEGGASNKSARVGFCIEDQEPYVSYRDVQGNTLWRTNPNSTGFTYGVPSSMLLYGTPTASALSSSISPNVWIGVSFGVVALVCLVAAVTSARKKFALAPTVEQRASLAMIPRRVTLRDDQEALPLYQEPEAGFRAASLASNANGVNTPAVQYVQSAPPLERWTIADVVAWVRRNGGDDSMVQVVQTERIDGIVIKTLDIEDIQNVFAFNSDAEREAMRNAFASLKSRDAGTEEPPVYR